MKLKSIILPILNSTVVMALSIPDFILNTQHPWITAHSAHLRLINRPDIATALCSLDPISPFTGIPPIPTDLFHTIKFKTGSENPRKWQSPLTWEPLIGHLAEIMHCPAALHHLQSLNVEIFYGSDDFVNQFATAPPLDSVAEKLAPLFAKTPKLTSLTWTVPCIVDGGFAKALEKVNFTLQSVTHLDVSDCSGYLAGRSPKLESLVIRVSTKSRADHFWDKRWVPAESVFLAVEGVNREYGGNHIKRVDVGPQERTNSTGLLGRMLDAMPNVTSINLSRGVITMGRYSPSFFQGGVEMPLQKWLHVLARFPYLRSLQLPDVSMLSLGYGGGPECGNAYFGWGGKSFSQGILKQEARTVEIATRFTLEAMPNLPELSIGNRNVEISRADTEGEGAPTVRWPWTDRLEAWSWENAVGFQVPQMFLEGFN